MTLAIVIFEDKSSVHIQDKDINRFKGLFPPTQKQVVFEYICGLESVGSSNIKQIIYAPVLDQH